MASVTPEIAARARQLMLERLTKLVEQCNCLWPIVKYRNGDGHADNCPAHVPLGSKRP